MKKKLIGLFFMLFGLISMLPAIHAQGYLLSTYKVVMEGNKFREDLTIANTSNDTTVYAITLSNYRMTDIGGMKVAEKTDTLFNADKYLKFFPRRVLLPPHQSQIVRLQVRRTASMKEGEYRTYLNFLANKKDVVDDNDSGVEQKEKTDTAAFSVNVKTVFAISIPVVVRIGNLSAEASLSDIGLAQKTDSIYNLKMTINRSGNKSVSGNIMVRFVPDKGKAIEVGKAERVTVYTEIPKRIFSMPLKSKERKLEAGKLLISYTGTEEENNKHYATIEYLIP